MPFYLSKTLNLLLQPLSLALIIGTVIIVLLPDFFNKYIVERTFTREISLDQEKHYLHDLDGDGINERILFANSQVSGRALYMILENSFSLVDQYNWKGEYFKMSNPFFGDYDNNGLSEIYSFTIDNDSLFINGMEYKSEIVVLDNVYIRKINLHESAYDMRTFCRDEDNGFIDVNNDGKKEIIFTYQALFSGIPRLIYSLDVWNKSLKHSNVYGANLNVLNIADINNDGSKEILCISSASANNKADSSYLYHDNNAWLFIFNHDLELIFTDHEIEGISSGVVPFIFKNKDENNLLVFTRDMQEEERIYGLYLYDKDFQLIKEKQINERFETFLSPRIIDSKVLIVEFNEGNKIYELDTELNLKLLYEHYDNIYGIEFSDIDGDGLSEYFITSKSDASYWILSSDFKTLTPIPGKPGKAQSLRNSKHEFAITTYEKNPNFHIYSYSANPYYLVKYPLYLLIYSFLFLLLHFIKKYRQLKIVEANQKMINLQLKALKNQIDPHFTFNVINSVNMVMAKGDLKLAENYFIKFTSLLRDILTNSDQMLVPLAVELGIIEKYMDLQRIRFKEKIQFTLYFEPNTDLSIPIPRMLIQEQVENAIKHGLMHKKDKGKLGIHVVKNDNNYNVIIEDDGIGREASKKYKENSTGKGSSINLQLLKIYHQIYGTNILYFVHDLKDEDGTACGTKVEFIIPIKK